MNLKHLQDGPVYLDYDATTPVDPDVLDAMLPYLTTHFGTPSSTHTYGRAAAAAVSTAREQVSSLIGATAKSHRTSHSHGCENRRCG